MRADDIVVHDDATVIEIDEAITRAIASPDLDPRILAAFIDARLEQRNRATKEPSCL